MHVRHGLGGLAQRDRQHAGSERVERAGMAGLVGLEQPLDLGDGFGRTHADRLVEHQPAGDRPALLLAAARHYSVPPLSSSASRSRATSGERSKLVDPGEIVVAGVQPEAEFRHVFHLPQRRRHAAADETGIAVERLDDGVVVA